MTDTEVAFLRAICENPDDDTPRLVFADWLTEQGGPVNVIWAAGIRAQIWLARGINDPAHLRQAEGFLSRYAQKQVRARLGITSYVTADACERGFPTTIGGYWINVSSVWPRIAYRVPIKRLNVFDAQDAAVVELLTLPGLSALRELHLQTDARAALSESTLLLLAACAALSGLEALTLGFATIGDTAANAILESPYLTNLRQLQLFRMSNSPPLSRKLADRAKARFGQGFDDPIPF